MIETIVVPGAAVAVGAAAGAWLYGAPMAARRGAVAKLAAHCAATSSLALTYDDGPGAALTPQVTELLASHDARATFFLLGRRAETSPSVADMVKRAGHEIGCHAHEHVHAWKAAPWASARDASHGFDTLERWLPKPCLFRPPYGKATSLSVRAAKRHKARLGWWTIDSGDTWEQLPTVDSVRDRVQRAGGGVVLLHDFDRNDDDATARSAFVLDVTRSLLELASERQWRVRPLGELMDEMENQST